MPPRRRNDVPEPPPVEGEGERAGPMKHDFHFVSRRQNRKKKKATATSQDHAWWQKVEAETTLGKKACADCAAPFAALRPWSLAETRCRSCEVRYVATRYSPPRKPRPFPWDE